MNSQLKIIQPLGIFDVRKGKPIQEEIIDLVELGINYFLIDFQSVTFMDSSGFGTMILILKTIKEKKVRLALCAINEQIRMILEMSGTTNAFEIFPNQESFLQQLTNQEEINIQEPGIKIGLT